VKLKRKRKGGGGGERGGERRKVDAKGFKSHTFAFQLKRMREEKREEKRC